MAEKRTVNWDTFSDHLQLMSMDLYKVGKYSDVTLVSDDHIQFKAHKIVLSACSPVFEKIIDSNPSQHPLMCLRGVQSHEVESMLSSPVFKKISDNNPTQHSLIYLRGIQSYEIQSILEFMYLGEGRFYGGRLAEFIRVVKDLEVIEIRDGLEREIVETAEKNMLHDKAEGIFQEKKTAPDLSQPKLQVLRDIETTLCPVCEEGFTLKKDMLAHYKSNHEYKYNCNHCDYQATHHSSLQKHIRSKHERMKYPCNQCDYKAYNQDFLQRHIESHHLGIRYPCNRCGYQARKQSSLKQHIKSVHEGVKYPCPVCATMYSDRSSMRTHFRNKHRNQIAV